MKKISILLSLSFLVLLNSCVIHRTAGKSGKVPPGQAKKRTGSKSAKPFAPGQQKKLDLVHPWIVPPGDL